MDRANRRRGIDYERLYEYRFRNVDQTAREGVWVEIANHIHQVMGAPQKVLDLAAGRGEFINVVPAPERWAVDWLDQGTWQPAVKAIIGNVFDIDLPPAHFDGVFISNFLEHLASQEQVADLLQLTRDSLAPGGVVAVLGPNFRYCAKDYFDCADHVLALTHGAVEEHLAAAGFEIQTVVPRFLPYSFRSLLPPSPTLTRLYLKAPAAWRLLGKQFLVVGRVPGPDGDQRR